MDTLIEFNVRALPFEFLRVCPTITGLQLIANAPHELLSSFSDCPCPVTTAPHISHPRCLSFVQHQSISRVRLRGGQGSAAGRKQQTRLEMHDEILGVWQDNDA